MTRARMPGRSRRPSVPVVIRCHRTPLLKRAAWFVRDLWDFLTAPHFRG